MPDDVTAEQGSKPDADIFVYRCEGDPFSSSWVGWILNDRTMFNGHIGDLQGRRDGTTAVVRMQPNSALANMSRRIHGGAIMTFADISIFLGAQILGVEAARGLTVDLNVQFVGGADLERPVDALVQVTRETGRLVFVRGTIEQAGAMIAGFMGILRKAGQ